MIFDIMDSYFSYNKWLCGNFSVLVKSIVKVRFMGLALTDHSFAAGVNKMPLSHVLPPSMGVCLKWFR